ncbi:type II toxin-antitoxin system RelB/DinJ family antitoxin [uncultured Cardiobacterium sp.]|uniref:type II toxin-antitoxin system RelB/DinJ family antitoxin n=1 Tax=uncultured Cardiobacterium sp. TaxID=417619 RepID=UPI002612A411|nr:type II toxin-antitoxin system RelB/DinJ family antitoxin [uncultured Cardiobacterium sp.]
MDTIIRCRIPDDLKTVFVSQCEGQGLTASLVMRKLIEGYVADNAQIDIFKQQKRAKK